MSLNRVRLALSLSGMVVAIVAIMLDDRRIVWGAIALGAASDQAPAAGPGRQGNVTWITRRRGVLR